MKKLRRLLPKFYVCRDVVVIYWLDYEIVLPRIFGGGS